MQKYIIIQPLNGATSSERAEEINRELYNISRPTKNPKDASEFFLSSHEHNGEVCLEFSDEDFLPVNSAINVNKLKTVLSEVSNEEKAQLEAYLNSLIGSKVYFKDIVPSTVTVRTKEEMQLLGWFEIKEMI